MTNAIRSTIITAVADHEGVSEDGLEYQYGGPINAAEQALLEREYSITDRIIEVALGETNFDREEIESLLIQAGLTFRPQPEPVEELPVEELGGVEDRVARLEAGQVKIVEALDRLSRLAEKHLGSSAL